MNRYGSVIGFLRTGLVGVIITSMDLDSAHVRSFLAIVRCGGYHRAADALHLTQPAISRHMRRLEQQLGEPLFMRRGRGVELTAYGERAARELQTVLAAHDQALVRLTRGTATPRPFMLGTVENIVDPLLPNLLTVVRDQIGERPLALRVDRSLVLAAAFAHGDIDAAIVLDPGGTPDPLELGPLTLRWWSSASVRVPDRLPDPLPLVAYDEPCHMRDLAVARVRELGLDAVITGESPHLSGVQSAARHGLGYTLLADGGDGLRAILTGPLSEPIQTRLWLLLAAEHRSLAPALRAALWRATPARHLAAA
jgi:DNA-binding transcriptional LysR family regulator